MKRKVSLVSRFYRARSALYKRRRLLFPSPAEVRLIQIMGGKALTLPFLKATKTGFSFTLVLSMGTVLRKERMTREVRVGSKYVDFGNDIRRGVEVDGQAYHSDIVEQIERDEYFASYGWRVLHIPARDLYLHGDIVYWRVKSFLAD